MLGCKLQNNDEIFDVTYELIDTCWDVNLIGEVNALADYMELIDTCWDVNLASGTNNTAVTNGINRYMLGCK